MLQSDSVIDDQFWLVKPGSWSRYHQADSKQGGLVLGRTSVGISAVWRAIVSLNRVYDRTNGFRGWANRRRPTIVYRIFLLHAACGESSKN